MEVMKFFIVVVLLSLLSPKFGFAKPPVTHTKRERSWDTFHRFIIGGTEVDDIADFPYALSLRYVDIHVCGASIIALNWALSAGHCFESYVFPDMVTFRAGSLNRFQGGIVITAEQYFVHPLFDPNSYDYDVAVIRTIEPFVGENVQPIPLIDQGFYIRPGTIGTISGWGIVDEGYLPMYLQKLDLPIWDQGECYAKWFGEITSNMFCAGGERGYDSCNGDSGGAMVVDGVQVGIISTGATTCAIDYPGVYVNITHPSIRGFIRQRTGI